MRREPRRLAYHHHVHITDREAGHAYSCDDVGQQREAVGPLIGWVVVRKELPDVAQTGRTEQRVDDGVGQDVGIRVTGKPEWVGNGHATQDQGATGLEPVRIVPDSDPIRLLPSPRRAAHQPEEGPLRW